MRTLISIIIIFTGMPFYAICQINNYGVTLIINEGTTIYNNGSYNNVNSGGGDGALDVDGKMVVIGNWINNAANNALINVDAVGTITMAGAAMQTISGSSATTFETLEINNSTGGAALKLDTNINIYDSLIITDGNIDLNGNNINLGNLGLLTGENNDNRIYGTAGEIIASRTLSASTAYTNIAGLGIDIITDVTAPGATQIKRSHAEIELNVSANKSILRSFEITPTINNSLNAILKINYFDNEMNSLTESDFVFYKSPTGANPWTERISSVVNISDNYVEETGLNDFSKWSIGQKGAPLPVELLSFTAQWLDENETDALLQWQTATEINNEFFTLDLSTDGVNFTTIGTVNGAGNSSSTLNYQYIDNTLPQKTKADIFYYRLKQTDFDGQYSYGNIQVLTRGTITIIGPAPNPIGDELNFTLISAIDGKVNITITDVIGQPIKEEIQTTHKGIQQIKIPLPGLASGPYLLLVSTSDGVEKINKQFLIK